MPHHCCVVGCNHVSKNEKNLHFYRFPKKNKKQVDQWVKAVKRINSDGSRWQPSDSSRICSSHFANGEKSDNPGHPSYGPTIFPTDHLVAKSKSDIDRFERLRRRNEVRFFSSFYQSDFETKK